ncbi:MAG: bifunctional phosphoserine phosphatase/homoserine phosphotransferase ThrH [Treponema sp.]|jgi:phosphoserine/homoserine phosphotransferase|nr:bifunctional phosphoserine phosphatase/homoserine phosphotransferase ThrH [Treponema sp.]
MDVVCLDLEGVLVPEIWIAFAEAAGIPEFRRTTRDEPDYDRLMRFRIDLLERHGLKLPDIQRVIGGMDPLPGAVEFCAKLRARTQLIILSDTFEQFARPLMAKLGYPTLFCNRIAAGEDGRVTGYRLRQGDGKRRAVAALRSLNMRVFAAGDSFNDLNMINEADGGCLFRAPDRIRLDYPDIPREEDFDGLLERIEGFLADPAAG